MNQRELSLILVKEIRWHTDLNHDWSSGWSNRVRSTEELDPRVSHLAPQLSGGQDQMEVNSHRTGQCHSWEESCGLLRP